MDGIFVGTPGGRVGSTRFKDRQVVWPSRAFPIGERKTINGAPRAADGKVFIGNSGAEFGTRGYVETYDAETGDQIWRFYTVQAIRRTALKIRPWKWLQKLGMDDGGSILVVVRYEYFNL